MFEKERELMSMIVEGHNFFLLLLTDRIFQETKTSNLPRHSRFIKEAPVCAWLGGGGGVVWGGNTMLFTSFQSNLSNL